MDYFGLNSPKDLPKLKEVFEEDVAPTLMLDLDANGNTIDEEPLNMIVSETGELVEQIELADGEILSPVIAGVVTDETLETLDVEEVLPHTEEEIVTEDIVEVPEAAAEEEDEEEDEDEEEESEEDDADEEDEDSDDEDDEDDEEKEK
jgi:segregation and condensation protein B